MDAVRYRPGDALRWLETGAEAQRKSARDKGRSILVGSPNGSARGIKDSVASAAGALVDLGKGAYADLVKRQAEAYEVILSEDEFSVSKPSGPRIYRYAEVTGISQERDKAIVHVGQTNLTFKPYAYITAGRVKVPIGWNRNGMEVPFELLIEELSARCRVTVDHK